MAVNGNDNPKETDLLKVGDIMNLKREVCLNIMLIPKVQFKNINNYFNYLKKK